MLFTLVALSPFLALGNGATSVQAPAEKISVDFVVSNPVKPPVTRYV